MRMDVTFMKHDSCLRSHNDACELMNDWMMMPTFKAETEEKSKMKGKMINSVADLLNVK